MLHLARLATPGLLNSRGAPGTTELPALSALLADAQIDRVY